MSYPILSLIFCVTLGTQGFFTVKPCMVRIVGTLAGMTARTGHHLTGSGVKDVFSDWMGKNTMFLVTFAAHIINGCFGHGRMVRAVGRMAIVAGICHLVLVFCRFVPLESRFVTLAADVTFLALEQPFIIAGVRGMTGHAAVIFVTDQVIMG